MSLFSDNLKTKMKEKDMTQELLSKSSGISQGSISLYLRKKNIPNALAIIKMARSLDCSTDELICL